jgi:hypothetical protein
MVLARLARLAHSAQFVSAMNVFRRPSIGRQLALHLLMLSLLFAPLLGHSLRTALPNTGDALAQAMAASICSSANDLPAGKEVPDESKKSCLRLCTGCCAAAPAQYVESLVPAEVARTTQPVARLVEAPSAASSLRLPLSRAPPASV